MRLKSYSLGGHKIKIEYKESVADPQTGELVLGLTEPLQNKISVSTHWNGSPMAEEAIEHTMWHEIVHFILTIMGEVELNGNEKFVDSFGSYLHQIDKTKKAR
jgi:hypothetical protein